MSIHVGKPARTRRALGLLVALAAVFTIGSAPTAAATPLRGTFGGEAYATYANVVAGPISVQLGRTAAIGCPCQGTNNQTLTSTTASLSVLNVLRADATFATMRAGRAADGLTADMRASAKVTGLSALNGLITADTVKAVANTHADGSSITSSSIGSELVNLRIGGVAIAATVGSNTRLTLPGIGYVTLREVSRSENGVTSGGITVNMIHIVVTTANALSLPIGAQIIVAHARSSYTRVTSAAVVGGAAWAVDASANLAIAAGRVGYVALVGVPCQGTNGAVLSNSVNVTTVAGIISAGTAVSTAFGSVSTTNGVARTTSRIESLRLLGGLVTADVVTSVSRSSWSTSTGGSTAGGSTVFTNLRILGLLRPVSVPPNTRVTLPLLGYVTLNEQVRGVNSSVAVLNVTAIHIVITAPLNLLGLPVGTEIRIAVARSSALAL